MRKILSARREPRQNRTSSAILGLLATVAGARNIRLVKYRVICFRRILGPVLVLTIYPCLQAAGDPCLSAPPGDAARTEFQRPELLDFPKDLIGNFRALASTDNLLPLLAGGLATGLAFLPDQRLARHFRDSRPSNFSRPAQELGTLKIVAPVMGGALVTGFLLRKDDTRFRSMSYSLAQGLVMNTAIVYPMKSIVGRERPDGSNFHSFPSGHTSTAFTWATVVSEHYGWKAGVPAYLGATYVGFSRMEYGVHYLSDVVAGAAIGYIIGRTVSRRARGDSHRLQWNVTPAPGGGLALSVGFRPRKR